LVPVIDRGTDLLVERRSALVKSQEGVLTAYGEVARLLRELKHLAVAGSEATPLPVVRGVDERDVRRILEGLSRGATTESMARDLGVTPRTVEKRIARLKEAVGVTTICELGIEMGRAGWPHSHESQ